MADLKNFNILNGVELSNGSHLLAVVRSGQPVSDNMNTVIFERTTDGVWSDIGQVRWLANGGISLNPIGDSLCLLSAYGSFLEFNNKKHIKPKPLENREDKDVEFRFSKVIGSLLYVGGTDRCLFEKKDETWIEINTQQIPKGGESFETLTGFNSDELYGFGWNNKVCTNESGTWEEVKIDSDYMFYDSTVHNEKVYAGGMLGSLIEGRKKDWRLVESDLLNSDIISLCSYKESLYLLTPSKILKMDGNDLITFAKAGVDYKKGSKMGIGPSGLWVYGSKCISLYNLESGWKTVYS